MGFFSRQWQMKCAKRKHTYCYLMLFTIKKLNISKLYQSGRKSKWPQNHPNQVSTYICTRKQLFKVDSLVNTSTWIKYTVGGPHLLYISTYLIFFSRKKNKYFLFCRIHWTGVHQCNTWVFIHVWSKWYKDLVWSLDSLQGKGILFGQLWEQGRGRLCHLYLTCLW